MKIISYSAVTLYVHELLLISIHESRENTVKGEF